MFRFNRVFNHAYIQHRARTVLVVYVRFSNVFFYKFSTQTSCYAADRSSTVVYCGVYDIEWYFEGHLTWNDWYIQRFYIYATCWFLLDIYTRSLWQHSSFFHFYWFTFNVERNFPHLHSNNTTMENDEKIHTQTHNWAIDELTKA